MSTTRAGFKRTEVGQIPENWEVLRISEFSTPVRGASPRPAGDPRFFDGADIAWLTVASLTGIPAHQTAVRHTESMLTREGRSHSRTLQPGTVVLANSGFSLGVAKLLEIECCANDGIAALLRMQGKVHPLYLVHWLNSITNFLRETVAIGNDQPNLNTARIGRIAVAVPPLQEQVAIAAALSDVDNLTSSLEMLIAKKRDIKQGAMEELLTGARRLPGFRGKWARLRIDQFTSCTSGGTPSTNIAAYWGGEIPWMSSGELHLRNVYAVASTITQLGLENSSAKLIQSGCVLVGLAGQGKTRGTVAINRIPLATNQSIGAIWPSAAYITEYLYHNLASRYEELREVSSGQGGRGGLSLGILGALEVDLPANDEQRAIAAILSDMDAEIATLEEKLAKARALKQGMMQVLLTGEVRLA